MFILSFLLILQPVIFAQVSPLSDVDIDRRMVMPRSLALSGNQTARIGLNESIYFNPASSAHSRCMSAEGGFMWNSGGINNGRIDSYYVSAIDTENELFGGGMGYSKRDLLPGGSEWELRGIINKLALSNKLGVGIGVSYLSYKHLDQESNNLNADAGLLWLLAPKSTLGVTAYNLFGDKNKINTRSIAFGFRQTMWDFFSIDIDFEHRFSKKITAGAALELVYKDGFMLTISGKRNQNLANSYWGLGLGYLGPKISFIYGTMNAITAPYSFAHSFSIRLLL